MDKESTPDGQWPDGLPDEAIDQALAAALRGKMAERNLKQNMVAERAGIPVTTFARYYNGTRAMPASRFFVVANAIGVEPGEIVKAAMHILEGAKK